MLTDRLLSLTSLRVATLQYFAFAFLKNSLPHLLKRRRMRRRKKRTMTKMTTTKRMMTRRKKRMMMSTESQISLSWMDVSDFLCCLGTIHLIEILMSFLIEHIQFETLPLLCWGVMKELLNLNQTADSQSKEADLI